MGDIESYKDMKSCMEKAVGVVLSRATGGSP